MLSGPLELQLACHRAYNLKRVCKRAALFPVVATSYIRAEKRHVESRMIVAKQAQRADFLNG